MKIKDLIKHLKTLDQDKELVVTGVDPTDWEYSYVVEPEMIQIETLYPSEENGLIHDFGEVEPDPVTGEEIYPEHYVIRIDC